MDVSFVAASSASSLAPEIPYNELVERMHMNYAALPEELCAASRPSSPSSEARTTAWQNQLAEALKLAAGDTTHPKWGYVSRITKLACTSRRYVGVAPGVRVGEGRVAKVAEEFKWVLPETEEEWGEDATPSPEVVNVSEPPSADKGKAKATVVAPSGEKVQASLGFRVVKRSSVTDAKGGRGAAPKPKLTTPARSPTAPAHKQASIQDAGRGVEEPSPRVENKLPDVSQNPQLPQIAEVPELSFLPPSFPSQLQTSTPPLNFKRHKPPPIAPCSPPPSSPLSIHSPNSFDPSHAQRRDVPMASSSQSPLSPVRRPLKRAHTPDSSAGDAMDVSLQSPRLRAPPPKKAREDPISEQAPPSSGPQPVPPSTPPLPTSPVAAPVTPVSKGKGLGNAKGLPVPTTPDAHPLPTLTELLASSRRSRPRPRPPSRKQTPQSQHSAKPRPPRNHPAEAETDLPAVDEDEREPSPTKTYFSSPASGSSDSDSAVHRSPVSPLFTQNPGAFVPAFVSSQRPSANDDDPFLGARAQSQSQGRGLMRGSSGFFGMGYNSQFDVEGQVDRVSELLERDVDYNGWLRDVDEADEEMAPSQSQGAVGVDC
ncbi:hypothetical protein FKP32DRAFT_1640824 [Trametes sanguinea]|nr:hypothetical protein FKP32DRAFT_1640824 [Trametes sanguinea]